MISFNLAKYAEKLKMAVINQQQQRITQAVCLNSHALDVKSPLMVGMSATHAAYLEDTKGKKDKQVKKGKTAALTPAWRAVADALDEIKGVAMLSGGGGGGGGPSLELLQLLTAQQQQDVDCLPLYPGQDLTGAALRVRAFMLVVLAGGW